MTPIDPYAAQLFQEAFGGGGARAAAPITQPLIANPQLALPRVAGGPYTPMGVPPSPEVSQFGSRAFRFGPAGRGASAIQGGQGLRGGLRAAFPKGIARGIGPGLALSIGGPIAASAIPEGNLDTRGGRALAATKNVLTRGSQFAGLGAAFGPVGALGGGAGGALYGGFETLKQIGEEPKGPGDKQRDQWREVVGSMGLGASVATPLRQQLEIGLTTAQSDEERDLVLQEVLNQVPVALEQQQQGQAQQEQMLAAQAMIAQWMEPYLQNVTQEGEQRALATEQLAAQMPEDSPYRAQLQSQVSGIRDRTARTAAAYAAQAQTIPAMTALDSAQAIQAQIDQALQQQLLQPLYGGGTGGGSELDQLLAEAG